MAGRSGKKPHDTVLDERLREAMIIAEALARRMHHKLGGVIGVDELLDLAQPVMLEAVRAHDPRSAPFGPYLVMRLKWAMLEEGRKVHRRQRATARVVACAALERLAEADEEGDEQADPGSEADEQAGLARFLAQRAAAMALGLVAGPGPEGSSAGEETPEEQLARAELCTMLRRAVGMLPERHRALVERHYFNGESFEEIAVDLGLSKSWASRLHAQAMRSLAEALRPAM